MQLFRRLVLTNRKFVGLLLALVLAMKLLMPAGFMPTVADGHIVITICSSSGPMKMVMAIPGMDHGTSDGEEHRDSAATPCAFSGLSAPLLAAADPVLLATAILFVMVLGLRNATPPVITASPHLRPPLRAPPTTV